MSENETAIVGRARAGDEQAFRQLVELHSADAFRLAFRLTGERENADDVVQEAFLRAWRSLHRFDSRSRFGTWLHRIVVNCAMDHRAVQKLRRELSPWMEARDASPTRTTARGCGEGWRRGFRRCPRAGCAAGWPPPWRRGGWRRRRRPWR